LTRPFVQPAFSLGTVRGQHLANLLAGAHGWVERKRWLLENQRNAPAADLLQFLKLGLQKILPFEVDSPRVISPFPGSSRTSDTASVLLPDPDSPRIPVFRRA